MSARACQAGNAGRAKPGFRIGFLSWRFFVALKAPAPELPLPERTGFHGPFS